MHFTFWLILFLLALPQFLLALFCRDRRYSAHEGLNVTDDMIQDVLQREHEVLTNTPPPETLYRGDKTLKKASIEMNGGNS